jgi:polyhydroxybutyrate depolymerase
VFLLAAAIFAAACEDEDEIPEPIREIVTLIAADPTVPAQSCGSGGVPRGDSSRTLQHDGLERSYLLHVPPSYDGSAAMPLVVNLHGLGSNAQEQYLYSRFGPAADEYGFIVATPNGTGMGDAFGWNLLPSGVDDLGFIGALIDELERELCVDGDAIFAAGISNGSAIAQQLACAMPGRIAGVIGVAAAVYPVRCGNVDAAVGIVLFHGTDDRVVPYEGGSSVRNLPVQPVETVLARWAEHNGCTGGPSVRRHGEEVAISAYEGCTGDVPVVLYTVEGGGHTWPGSIDVPRLGPTTDDIDATDVAARFITGGAPLPAD